MTQGVVRQKMHFIVQLRVRMVSWHWVDTETVSGYI